MSLIFTTEDGSHSIFSKEYGVSYHSKHGAKTETQTVFIDAGLKYKSATSKNISILEIGFGTGLNAIMTLQEAIADELTIDYTTLEAYPLLEQEIAELNYGKILGTEMEAYFKRMHQLTWEQKHQLIYNFSILKQNRKFEEIDFKNQFDVIYFDAFAPTSQPELWEEPLLQKMYDALKPSGVLTTYCAKGVVKRTLKKVGFEIEALPGPPGKREMTRAIKH